MFYLLQLTDVEDEPKALLNLSASTVCLCLAALIPAEKRYNWIHDLEALTDEEYDTAQAFVSKAIFELNGGVMELQFIVISSVQSVTSDTLLELDTAEYNLNGQFDTTSFKWIVPSDGVYRLELFLELIDLSAWAVMSAWAVVNDTDVVSITGTHSTGIDRQEWARAKGDTLVYLSVGDELKFYAYQSDEPTSRDTPLPHSCKVWTYKLG